MGLAKWEKQKEKEKVNMEKGKGKAGKGKEKSNTGQRRNSKGKMEPGNRETGKKRLFISLPFCLRLVLQIISCERVRFGVEG